MPSHPSTPRERLHRALGFTLVEIMIVIILIGLLAAMAMPAYRRVQVRSQNTRFINDLRIARGNIDTYVTERGEYPPDGNAGFPAELDSYFGYVTWTRSTVLGGSWDWDYEQFGFKAGLSVYQPTASADQFLALDAQFDDGNLATGNFRSRDNGYIYIIEL